MGSGRIFDRISELAKQKGISINSLEKQADVSIGSVYKWNDVSPTIRNLSKVATALGCTIDEIVLEDKLKQR